MSELEKAQILWEENGAANYEIVVRHSESVWHSQDITLSKTGNDLTHSAVCTPAPTEGGTCEVKDYNANNYTVDGLFDTARSFLSGNYAEWTTVRYNEKYGFPESILVDDPEIIDEDVAWKVVEFQITE